MSQTITQERTEGSVTFFLDGKLLTRYIYGYGDDAARPYFHPVIGPTGDEMTRGFPMAPKADEPTDHPHHRSLWATHGSVNGVDNWNLPEKHGYTRVREIEPLTAPDTLAVRSDITDYDGNLLCHERLQVQIRVLASGARLFDWQVTMTAPENVAVELGDTKECGLCALRVPAPIQGNRGGTIENAEGGVGEAQCWGKSSRWCDYYGKLTPDGQTIGLAILCHPTSFRHPTHWHTRDYGLHAANPFGLSAFTKGAENGAYTIPAGESITFHYALVLHIGDSATANIEGIYQQWANP
jgi:hypothetical protein